MLGIVENNEVESHLLCHTAYIGNLLTANLKKSYPSLSCVLKYNEVKIGSWELNVKRANELASK